MHRFTFSKSLICATLGIISMPSIAALQPASEAALAGETTKTCHFNQDTSSDCSTTYRYTILTNNGREMLSRIDFSFPETDQLEIIDAQSTQPGGKPVALAPTQIDTRMAPNPDQGFQRAQQTSIAFPNLRIGTQISYTVREHTVAKPLMTHFHYPMMFGPAPVRSDAFRSTFTAEQPIVWRSELMEDFTFSPSSDNKTLVIEQKTPRFVNYINEAGNAYIRQMPRVEIASSGQVQDHLASLATRYHQILAANLPAGAARVVSGLKGLPAAGQVAGVMQYIHEQYRYMGDWRATDRGYVPFTLNEIEERGYGDCKDLSVLLTAMLQASGINAQTAWVSRGSNPLGLLLPGIGAANHAIVKAHVNGQVWWLDPTNPVFMPGRSMPDIQNRWALVIDAEGKVYQDHIPEEQPSLSMAVKKFEHFNRDGQARTTAEVQMGQMTLMQLSFADTDSGVSATDLNLCNHFGKEISDCKINREKTAFVVPERYKVQATLTNLRPLDNLSGQLVYKPAFASERWDSLMNYRRTGQLADLYMADPETVTYDITLSGAKVGKAIKACNVNSPWFDMTLSSQRSKDEYRYLYTMTQKHSWLSHDEIMSAPFEAMLQQARACNENMQQVVQLNAKG